MARMEEVELTNMCMVCDVKGNVLVQNKKGDRVFVDDTCRVTGRENRE